MVLRKELVKMAAIKSIAEIGKKFIEVTPGRSAQYAAGVRNPKKDWETATAAAEPAFEAGVQKAIATKAYGKGVKLAGKAKYQKGVEEKGVARWPVGVSLAEEAFITGYGPYRDEIERTTLPQRYARRDPRNLARVSALTKALGDLKEKRG